MSELLRKDLTGYNQASNLLLNEQIRKQIEEGKQIYHLAFGQSPFPVPEKLVDGLIKHGAAHDYLNVSGTQALREAICKFHTEFNTGMSADLLQPDNVIVSDGSKMLIYLIQTVCDAVILLKSPSWTTYNPQGQLAGHKQRIIIQTSRDEKWKITPDNLEKAIQDNKIEETQKILIFCNPCNPTGVVYSQDEMQALVPVLRRYNVTVINDEIYAHLTYTGDFTSLSKFYPERSIVTTGLSKWASAGGWRVGYAIFPPQLKPLKQAVTSAASHTYSCCAAPQQHATAEFLVEYDNCAEYMKHTRRILHAVSDMCCRRLNAAGIKVEPSQAGYYIFPDFEILKNKLRAMGISTGQQMCDEILKTALVSLLPGGPSHLRSDSELTTRLCYVNFDGAKALAASKQIGLDQELPIDFLDIYCSDTCKAIQSLIDWSENILENK